MVVCGNGDSIEESEKGFASEDAVHKQIFRGDGTED